MRAIGKIGSIECSYQQEKTNERDGSKYWGEKYTIFFEVGDDIHMVDSGWFHSQGKDGGLAILERRGIKAGVAGEMIIRYGFRDYNGRRYPECELVRFTALQQAQSQSPAPQAEPTPAEVAAGFAEAAEEAEKNEPKVDANGDPLPF